MFDFFANPARFEALSQKVRPFFFGAVIFLTLIGLPWGLFFSPPDYLQGDSVRIMYIHVPAAWMATIAYGFLACMSAIAFVWRHSLADEAARAAAPIGLAMTGLALATGAIWGKPTWGAWWVWDARLTSVLVLFFIYLGYLVIWDAVADKAKAARFARIFALVGFINVPIIKFSVDWWSSLHQPASIIRGDGPTIENSMLAPLLIMIAVYKLYFVWYVLSGVEASIIDARTRRAERVEPRRARLMTPTSEDPSEEEKPSKAQKPIGGDNG